MKEGEYPPFYRKWNKRFLPGESGAWSGPAPLRLYPTQPGNPTPYSCGKLSRTAPLQFQRTASWACSPHHAPTHWPLVLISRLGGAQVAVWGWMCDSYNPRLLLFKGVPDITAAPCAFQHSSPPPTYICGTSLSDPSSLLKEQYSWLSFYHAGLINGCVNSFIY